MIVQLQLSKSSMLVFVYICDIHCLPLTSKGLLVCIAKRVRSQLWVTLFQTTIYEFSYPFSDQTHKNRIKDICGCSFVLKMDRVSPLAVEADKQGHTPSAEGSCHVIRSIALSFIVIFFVCFLCLFLYLVSLTKAPPLPSPHDVPHVSWRDAQRLTSKRTQ